jgi:hypothetical protein
LRGRRPGTRLGETHARYAGRRDLGDQKVRLLGRRPPGRSIRPRKHDHVDNCPVHSPRGYSSDPERAEDCVNGQRRSDGSHYGILSLNRCLRPSIRQVAGQE